MKLTLVYIAGYVTRKNASKANDTFNYVEQFGRFILSMDRSGLNVPGNNIREWVCFCCIIFYSVVKNVCGNSLCDSFLDIAERFMFERGKKHGSILPILSNYCRLNSLVSNCEPKVKVLKPSN